jgi:2-C-methyl-D-erythritol 4-phosphate cytidylyltransferase
VVVAAGSGERLGRGVPKAFVELAGRPMLAWSLAALASSPVDRIVVVAPPTHLDRATTILEQAGVEPGAIVVPGGATRQESVRSGLDAVRADAQAVVCHDAARPMAGPELFAAVLAAVRPGGGPDAPEVHGAVPVLPSPDTVKRIRDGLVLETIPRAEVGLAQTPQAFLAEPLREAHRRAEEEGWQVTDDAMLVEALGYRVVAVPGVGWNFKVTSQDDLRRAESMILDVAAEWGGLRA